MAAALAIDQGEFDDLIQAAAKQAMWYGGDLSWKLRPEQLLLKNELDTQTVQLAVFNISRRLGKTFTLVCCAIEWAMKSFQKIRYGCAFLTDLEEFVLPAFDIILEDCPEELRPKYIRSRKVWQFQNGSEIKLVGLDKNPNGLRGNAISKIIIDEAGYVSRLKSIYTSVIIPATAKQKDIKLIFLSTPPESPDHFFVTLMEKAQLQTNGLYRILTIDDISDLMPEERARLLSEMGGESSAEAQREFFCRIIVDPTIALVPEFDESIHVKQIELPEFCHYWTCGDTGGVRDLSVFHLMGYDFKRGKKLFLDERWYDPQTGSEVMVKEVLAMEAGRVRMRWIDAAGQLRVDFMKQHNFGSLLPRKDELEATVNQVRLEFVHNKVEIDPKCKLLIATLRAGTFNRLRTDLARTETLGHCDAFMSAAYGLRHADVTNPIPPYNGARPDTHYIDQKIRKQNHSAYRKMFGG